MILDMAVGWKIRSQLRLPQPLWPPVRCRRCRRGPLGCRNLLSLHMFWSIEMHPFFSLAPRQWVSELMWEVRWWSWFCTWLYVLRISSQSKANRYIRAPDEHQMGLGNGPRLAAQYQPSGNYKMQSIPHVWKSGCLWNSRGIQMDFWFLHSRFIIRQRLIRS
jgi:hypothetical protein